MNIPIDSVTVMIPTYNQKQYVAQAIESCLMQDYRPLEIVVSDDCSTDGTGSVVSRYSDRFGISCQRNSTNLGRVANYANTLSTFVGTAWVVNLDGDDYYTDSTFISKAMFDIRDARHRGAGVVAHMGNHHIDVAKRYLPGSIVLDSGSLCVSGKTYFRQYHRAGQFAHMSCIYNVDVAKKVGGYDLDSVASDFHALMKVFLQGDVILSENHPGVWRVHGGNASLNQLRQKYLSAFSMYEDLAVHAKPFFSAEELELWKSEMRVDAYDDYILTACTAAAGCGGLFPLLKDFRFRPVFLHAIRIMVKKMLHSQVNKSKQL